jgi:hypothetical protein
MPVGSHQSLIRLAIELKLSLNEQSIRLGVQKFKSILLGFVRPSLSKLEDLVTTLAMDLFPYDQYPFIQSGSALSHNDLWIMGAMFVSARLQNESDEDRESRVMNRIRQLVHVHAPIWEIDLSVPPREDEGHINELADVMSRLNAMTGLIDRVLSRQSQLESLMERRRSDTPRGNRPQRDEQFTDSEKIISALSTVLKDKTEKETVTDSDDEASCKRSLTRKRDKFRQFVKDFDGHLYSLKAATIECEAFHQRWQMEYVTAVGNPSHRPKFDDDQRLRSLIHTIKSQHKILRQLILSGSESSVVVRASSAEFDNSVEQFFGILLLMRADVRNDAVRKWEEVISKEKVLSRTKEGHWIDYRALFDSSARGLVNERVFRWGRGRGRGRAQGRGFHRQTYGGRAAPEPQPQARIPQNQPHQSQPAPFQARTQQ